MRFAFQVSKQQPKKYIHLVSTNTIIKRIRPSFFCVLFTKTRFDASSLLKGLSVGIDLWLWFLLRCSWDASSRATSRATQFVNVKSSVWEFYLTPYGIVRWLVSLCCHQFFLFTWLWTNSRQTAVVPLVLSKPNWKKWIKRETSESSVNSTKFKQKWAY